MPNELLPLAEIVDLECLVEVLDNFYLISSELAYLVNGDGQVIAKTRLAEADLYLPLVYQRTVSIAGCQAFGVFVVAHGDNVDIAAPPPNITALLDSLARQLRLEVSVKLTSLQQTHFFDQETFSLREVLHTSPMAIGWSNYLTGEIEYINPAFEKLFGYRHDEIPTLKEWFAKAFPDEHYRHSVLMPWYEASRSAQHTGDFSKTCALVVTCKDGSLRHVELNVTYMGDRRLVNYSDVTDHFNIQERLEINTKLLEMVAKGEKLKGIMQALVEHVETELPDSICSVLLMDESQRLRSYIGPNLPTAYLKAIDGIPPGPSLGSCGTAAYRKERVVVENIYRSELWQNFTHLADLAKVKSCWSDPILSSAGEVLGTFAIYYPYPFAPTEKHLELIDFASNLASVAIENRRGQQDLERRANFDHLTGLANRGHFFDAAERALEPLIIDNSFYCMVMLDIDHFKLVNDRFGHKSGDKVLMQVANVMLNIVDDVDLVGRIGGEEFAIMLLDIDKQEAFKIAQQIRQAVEELAIQVGDHQIVNVTISAGIAQSREEGEEDISIDRLFGRADEALYQAKSLGRNRVEVFSKNTHN